MVGNKSLSLEIKPESNKTDKDLNEIDKHDNVDNKSKKNNLNVLT